MKASSPRRLPSIWVLLGLLAVVPTLLACAALTWIASATVNDVAERLANDRIDEMTRRFESDCRDYMRHASQMSDYLTDSVRQGGLPADRVDDWRPVLFACLRTRPEVASVMYAARSGDALMLMRYANRTELGRVYATPQPNGFNEHRVQVSLDSVTQPTTGQWFNYHLTERPWFIKAHQADGPVWIEPYQWFADPRSPQHDVLGVGFARVIRDSGGNELGTLIVDQTLSQLNLLLAESTQQTGAHLVLVGKSGPIARSADQNDPFEAALLNAPELSDDASKTTRLAVDGSDYWTCAASLEVYPGERWRLLAAVPSASMLEVAHTARRRMLWMSGAVITLGALLGGLQARRLAKPLQKLDAAASAIGRGEATQLVDPIGVAREIDRLGRSLDALAVAVQERIEMQTARDAAIEADRFKGRVVGHVSHELRTPLTAILGYTEILLAAETDAADDAVAAQRREDLRRIDQAGRHLLSIVNDLLDLARIQAGRMPITPTPFAVEPFAQDVRAVAEPLAARNRNTLAVACVGDVGTMTSDVKRVRQVLLNLLGNAAKFTQDGQITLRISADSAMVEFAVIDTGLGLTMQQIQRLFQPFSQVQVGSQRHASEGSGLGLAIAKQICERLGGSITVISEEGRGSTFTVRLPRHLPEVESRPDCSAA
ncbi:MAG: sensor histidine kinase [Tepidisphaeraceae bacterium]